MAKIDNEGDWFALVVDIADHLSFNIPSAVGMDRNHWIPVEMILYLCKEKEWPRIYSYLNSIWMTAPGEPWIHSIPHWHDLCDLLSESWVLEDLVTEFPDMEFQDVEEPVQW